MLDSEKSSQRSVNTVFICHYHLVHAPKEFQDSILMPMLPPSSVDVHNEGGCIVVEMSGNSLEVYIG